MTTDEIINKLGIEPKKTLKEDKSHAVTIEYSYDQTALNCIVAELSAGYEAQIKLMRDALQNLHDENISYIIRNNLSGAENNQCLVFARQALSQSSPLAALEEVRKAAKIEALEGMIPAFRHASIGVAGAGIYADMLRGMANELKE